MSIIGISGKKRSGKDSFFNIVNDIHPGMYKNVKYADKLKEICSTLTGLPLNYFYDGNLYDTKLDLWDMDVRKFMQILGTEVFRDSFDPDVWVKALESNLHSDDNYIITDVRFINEANWVKENGILIRINRPGLNNSDSHRSEVELDNFNDFDYVIDNDGTYEEYVEKISNILKKIM